MMMMIEVLEPRDVGARQEKKIVGLSSHGALLASATFFAVEMTWRLFVRCWGILDIYYCFFGAVFFISLSLFRTL